VQPETISLPPDGERTVTPTPAGLPARAWWGEQLVAETSAAVRVEEPGRPPALYFPCADVRLDHFREEGHRVECPVKGSARLWSAVAPADGERSDAPSSADWGGSDVDAGSDGTGVLWSFAEPRPGLEWLEGLAAFDHDRVRVELVEAHDVEPGDGRNHGAGSVPPSEVTATRFPDWGDAAHLVDVLDVRALGEGRYVSATRTSWRRPVVEGSQMLGQAIVAAGRHAPGRRVVSAHMVFVRPADAGRPLDLALDEVSAGRTFTSLAVHVDQGGRRCAEGTLLLDVTAPGVVRHAVAPPDVPGPDASEPYDMSVTGRDIRIVDGAYTDDPDAPVGPPTLDAWVRFRRVPDDPVLHAALLAQFTGHLSIAAALRPHAGIGQRAAHRTLSTAINAIGLSLHGEVRADRWMLYRHHSTFAGDGMTHAECRVHDQGGGLLASFTVDAMVRSFTGGAAAGDDRRAL
jgi:acyl-CoA thioesterase II